MATIDCSPQERHRRSCSSALGSTIFAAGWIAFASAPAGLAGAADQVPVAVKEDVRLRSGAYVGIGGLYSISYFSNGFTSDELQYGNALGLDARGGYRFNPNLALEGHFQWNSDFDQHVVRNGRKTGQSISTEAFTVNALAYYPVGPIHPFLLAGIGFLHAAGPLEDAGSLERFAHSDAAGFAARFGGGFETWVNDHLTMAMGLTYVTPTGDVAHLQHLAWDWGFRWHF